MLEKEIEKIAQDILGEGAKIDRQLLGGMMNISYIIKDKDEKKYILYIPTEQANEMVNRPLEKEHQKIIYNLGITSKNVYLDDQKGIKMNEYIEGNSLDKIATFDYSKLAILFHKLHDSIMLSREDYAPFERFVNIYEKEALSYQDGVSPLYNQL